MAVQFRNAVPRGGWEVQGRDHPGAQSPVAVARAGGGGDRQKAGKGASGRRGGRVGALGEGKSGGRMFQVIRAQC